MNDKINFHEAREFGDLISATFQFIRQNFKPLGKALLFIAGPFVLLTGLFTSTVIIKLMSNGNPTQITSISEWINSMATYSLLNYVFLFITNTVMAGVVYEYLIFYEKFGLDGFTFNDLLDELKADSLHILGISFFTTLLIFAGMFLFFIPGIYLAIILSPAIFVLLYEQKNVFESFDRCRHLMSGYWWFTFGYLFILVIIQSVLAILIGIPHSILTDTLMFNSSSGHLSNSSQIILMASSILTSVTNFLYTIPMIGIAFHYFNLVERKEGTGLMNRIDELNSGL